MIALSLHRRSLLLGVAGLGLGQVVPGSAATAASSAEKPYVLAAAEGERVVRPGGDIVIKVDPVRGSPQLAMGTQHLKVGAGIPVHRHEQEDEILIIQEGQGTVMLDGAGTPFEKGATIYIPKGYWHGVENPTAAVDLVWIVTPPGLEAFFREVGSRPGGPPKSLTREQIHEIGRRHGTIFRA